MSALPDENLEDENARLEAATDHAIAACDGDMRSAIRALILANEFLQWELETKVSKGYGRGVRRGRSDGQPE
jgi:hypothetical protein